MKPYKLPENTADVISLSKKRFELKGCQHKKILIDRDLSFVKCRECNEKLNPVMVLARFAEEENNLLHQLRNDAVKFNNISQKLDEKQRTKCDHCGRITRVNIDMKPNEWCGWESCKPKKVKG